MSAGVGRVAGLEPQWRELTRRVVEAAGGRVDPEHGAPERSDRGRFRCIEGQLQYLHPLRARRQPVLRGERADLPGQYHVLRGHSVDVVTAKRELDVADPQFDVRRAPAGLRDEPSEIGHERGSRGERTGREPRAERAQQKVPVGRLDLPDPATSGHVGDRRTRNRPTRLDAQVIPPRPDRPARAAGGRRRDGGDSRSPEDGVAVGVQALGPRAARGPVRPRRDTPARQVCCAWCSRGGDDEKPMITHHR